MKLRLGVTALAVALAGLAVPAALSGPTPHATADEPSGDPPVELRVPKRAEVASYDGQVYDDIGLNLIAPEDRAFEIRSTRADWKSPIRSFWQSPSGPVELPAGLQSGWKGLDKFLKVTLTWRKYDKVVVNRRLNVCLNTEDTQRTNPDAPLRSPYPEGCPSHPFTIGAVQGIQQGWLAKVPVAENGLKLAPGKYDVTATITPAYARALGIDADQASRSYLLVVKKGTDEEARRAAPRSTSDPSDDAVARPASKRPSGQRAGEPGDAVPDLRSLPAFGMTLSPNSKYLRFSATVWNAGDGPMVVDGFRRGNGDIMDAYQYFIDSEGNQTGYRKVGTMIWHQAPSHNHWHFEDFARYTLLASDKSEVVRSRKESFCLANTDAVDYTVPGADWDPENTDLHTACGDRGTISLREVLASGSGDTYEQFRAGQAFRVDNLPNGVYYIAVEGNPNRNLVESDTSNNLALRKVKLGGTKKHRTLKVSQVGVVDDAGEGEDH